MTIFAVSDIHSYYTPLITALNDAGFEKNNENHLLVICGDLFDRGSESQKVLDYILSVNNKVLVRGNHEDLIQDVFRRGYAQSHDYHNRTFNTIIDLAPNSFDFNGALYVAEEKVNPILEKTVNFFETEHYIFTHSILPNGNNWRKSHERQFSDARWSNPFDWANFNGNKTDKIVVHGHWSNSYYWVNFEHIGTDEWSKESKQDIVYFNNTIGLDGCVALSGKVNCLVVEDNLLS